MASDRSGQDILMFGLVGVILISTLVICLARRCCRKKKSSTSINGSLTRGGSSIIGRISVPVDIVEVGDSGTSGSRRVGRRESSSLATSLLASEMNNHSVIVRGDGRDKRMVWTGKNLRSKVYEPQSALRAQKWREPTYQQQLFEEHQQILRQQNEQLGLERERCRQQAMRQAQQEEGSSESGHEHCVGVTDLDRTSERASSATTVPPVSDATAESPGWDIFGFFWSRRSNNAADEAVVDKSIDALEPSFSPSFVAEDLRNSKLRLFGEEDEDEGSFESRTGSAVRVGPISQGGPAPTGLGSNSMTLGAAEEQRSARSSRDDEDDTETSTSEEEYDTSDDDDEYPTGIRDGVQIDRFESQAGTAGGDRLTTVAEVSESTATRSTSEQRPTLLNPFY